MTLYNSRHDPWFCKVPRYFPKFPDIWVSSCVSVIGFSFLVELWVIKIKKPMILCARSTSRSREQSTKRISRSENMRKVCLFYSQNNKIVWLSNMEDTFLEKCTRCAKVCGLLFLDWAFRVLIGWAVKVRSRVLFTWELLAERRPAVQEGEEKNNRENVEEREEEETIDKDDKERYCNAKLQCSLLC